MGKAYVYSPFRPFPKFFCIVLVACVIARAQAPNPDQDTPANQDSSQQPQNWNLFYQATSIGQYHGTFTSPYQGPFSLQNYPERDASLTTTLYFGFRPEQNTYFYFDPEIAGGRGFSGVDGLANSSNGELPRVASATPKPYIARLFISHDFAFGKETEFSEADEDQLQGSRPVTRYTISAGRFTLTDFFDDNRYSHDPRSQFTGWAVMFNGAWDYPADTRGYTWGWVHEFRTRNWSFRYASAAMPRVANGSQFDRRIFRDRGDVVEQERRFNLHEHPGVVRVLEYMNHARAGTYSEALALSEATHTRPDVTATRQWGTRKYGVGINFEQEITKNFGVFARLGWNDGKTESFAFTAVDRLATGGASFTGAAWRRPNDQVGAEMTFSGISGIHALYLQRGGYDFLIGDGPANYNPSFKSLQYAPEAIFEMFYNAKLLPWLYASLDLQHAANPAYNQDRGPVWIPSLRLHVEVNARALKPAKH